MSRAVYPLIGAAVAFVVTFVLYQWLNPILEARTDWLREMQGFLWSLIPVGTLVGALVGRRWGTRRTPTDSHV
jgi:flagellin-like protein